VFVYLSICSARATAHPSIYSFSSDHLLRFTALCVLTPSHLSPSQLILSIVPSLSA
jgi:hypothetical protein